MMKPRLLFSLIFVSVIVMSLTATAAYFYMQRKVWSVACPGCTWDTNFRPEITLPQENFVTSVVWSPNGKYLSVGSLFETKIAIYDTSDWKLIGQIQRDEAAGENNSVIQFTNDSQSIIAPRIKYKGNDDISVQKWNVEDKLISEDFPSIFGGESNKPFRLEARDAKAKADAISPDDASLAAAVGGSGEGHVLIWRTSDSKLVQDILCGRHTVPEALAYSPDGKYLAVGECLLHKISVYDARSGDQLFQTEVDVTEWLYNFISYSPDGDLIAVASSNDDHGMVTFLRALDGTVVASIPRAHATVSNFQWLTNNIVLVSYDAWNPDGGRAKIWDIDSGEVVGEIDGKHLQFVSMSPDRSHVAAVIGNKVVIGNVKQKLIGD